MQGIADFWSRFNLSLVGRINIAKCFLLSQVNYFGSIFLPTNADICWMQNLMDRFCIGNLRLSKEKLYTPLEKGGIGLINISHALKAQQINWFKRAAMSSRDNWRYDLWVCGSGNCMTPDPDKLDPESNPILSGLTNSFYEFLKIFYKINNNFLSAFVLNNPCISVEEGYPYPIRTRFWLQNGNTCLNTLSKIRFCDLLVNNKLKPFALLNESLGLNLSFTMYIRLSGIVNRAVQLNYKPETPALGIDNFLESYKKGSKKIRKIFECNTDPFETVKTSFLEISQTIGNDDIIFKGSLKFVGFNSLPNHFREFLFKFFHNRLGLNTRISHFTDNSRWCTFCSIVGKNLGPFDDETFLHLFITCPSVKKVHDDISSSLLSCLELRKENWLGISGENPFLRLFVLSVQYQIWCSKLSGTLPNSNHCAGEAIYLMSNAVRCNPKISEHKNNLNCLLSRLWDQLSRPRW
jgi:hypothetical protein